MLKLKVNAETWDIIEEFIRNKDQKVEENKF